MTDIGVVILSVFAVVWCAVGIHAFEHVSPLWYGVPLVVSGAFIAFASRPRFHAPPASPEELARRGRLVGIASGAEGLLILIVVNVCAKIGRRDLFAPVVAMIVGLHFIPLARGLSAPLYYATGALLVALGIVGVGIRDVDHRTVVVTVGAACVLWLTSAVILARIREAAAAP